MAFAFQPPVPAGDLHAWPCPALSCAGPQMHGIHEICCGLARASECPNGQRSGLNVKDFEDFAAHDGLQLITPSR